MTKFIEYPVWTAQPMQQQKTGEVETPAVPTPGTWDAASVEEFVKKSVEQARQQEKDKLYSRLDKAEQGWKSVQEQLAEQAKEREAAVAAEAAARKAAEDEARAKAEAEMDIRTLLETRQNEWQQQLAERESTWQSQLAQVQQERETERATLEMERKFNELREYTQAQVNAAQDEIAPELLDFVSGNTREEIDASIANVKAKSLAIVEAMQAAAQQQRAQMRGVSPTGYSTTGPLDTNSGTKTFSADELRGMSMSDYAKHRGSLLGGMAQRGNQGLFA